MNFWTRLLLRMLIAMAVTFIVFWILAHLLGMHSQMPNDKVSDAPH